MTCSILKLRINQTFIHSYFNSLRNNTNMNRFLVCRALEGVKGVAIDNFMSYVFRVFDPKPVLILNAVYKTTLVLVHNTIISFLTHPSYIVGTF